jgi:glycosyltransferase involved in cell wall biosynthesis
MSAHTEIRLSICIATFNRAAFIEETLDSIVPQLPAEVELLVVDGASTDATEQRLLAYQSNFPRLRYVRLATNSGVDRDFNTAVEMATGEYCWLLSDDDLLQPEAVATVLGGITAGYSLIVANAQVRNADFTQVLQERRLPFETDRVYGPAEMDRLFAEVGDYLTFIGCVVIRRSIWLQRSKEPYFGSLFIHVGVIFQQSLPAAALVLADPLILIRYGNAMWKSKDFEIWMFKWPGMIRSLPGLSDAARSEPRLVDPWRRPKTLLFYRAKGTYSMTEYRHWIAPRLQLWHERLPARLVAMLPGFVANLVALGYFRLRGARWRMALMDIRNSRYHFTRWFGAKS